MHFPNVALGKYCGVLDVRDGSGVVACRPFVVVVPCSLLAIKAAGSRIISPLERELDGSQGASFKMGIWAYLSLGLDVRSCQDILVCGGIYWVSRNE